jgi:hypothetical protein
MMQVFFAVIMMGMGLTSSGGMAFDTARVSCYQQAKILM